MVYSFCHSSSASTFCSLCWKKLSSWLFLCAVLYLMLVSVFFMFPIWCLGQDVAYSISSAPYLCIFIYFNNVLGILSKQFHNILLHGFPYSTEAKR